MALLDDNQKRIGVFIDGSNIWHCQKENSWRIDFYKLKKYLAKRGQLKGLYYFTPEAPYMKQFLQGLDKVGYTIEKKPLKKIRLKQKGKVGVFKHKGNLDMEMGLMMVGNADKYDEFIILSGDSDFETVADQLKLKGKNIVVMCNKSSLSLEMRKVSNQVIYLHKLKNQLKYKKPR